MGKSLEKEIYWIFQDKYLGKWHPAILKDITRLKNGEPLDYIIGWTPFLNCKIDLSLKPFIPRSETEYWTEQFLYSIKQDKKDKLGVEILDIFSGSGCIGAAILKNTKKAQVDFAEIEPKFIQQIKINLQLNKIAASRYKVIHSDIFKKIKKQYDYILANPPYIPLKNIKKVDNAVLNFEPRIALFGRNDGLWHIRNFLKQAKNHLKPDGQIWMEFDSPQKNKIADLLQRLNYQKYQFFKDQYKKWRYAIIY